MQELIDAELTTAIDAGPHERTDDRTNHRNGGRTRLLSTPAGDVELRIPKVRVGSFFPSLLEPRRRVDKALWAVIMTGLHHRHRTRKVDDLVRALGCDSGISRSTVSRVCTEIDAEVDAFRTRRSTTSAFPYVFVEATYIKARKDHRIVSRAVVVATGVAADGNREVLGVAVGDSEGEVFCTTFLRSLRERGLGGVRLVISDSHSGLKAAIARVFQGAVWQRCKVHLRDHDVVRRSHPLGHRRCGTSSVGRRLDRLARARDARLRVVEDHWRAQRFYEGEGCVPDPKLVPVHTELATLIYYRRRLESRDTENGLA